MDVMFKMRVEGGGGGADSGAMGEYVVLSEPMHDRDAIKSAAHPSSKSNQVIPDQKHIDFNLYIQL